MILSRYSPLPQPFPRHQVLLGEDEAVWDNSDPMNCTNGIQWILNVIGAHLPSKFLSVSGVWRLCWHESEIERIHSWVYLSSSLVSAAVPPGNVHVQAICDAAVSSCWRTIGQNDVRASPSSSCYSGNSSWDDLIISTDSFRITGDTCNMIGAILTHQQPLQQIIGVYYILQDIVLLSQFVYYTKVYHASRGGMANSSIIVPMLFVGVLGTSSLKTRFSTDNIELHGRVGRS